jgi:hypothetical protein
MVWKFSITAAISRRRTKTSERCLKIKKKSERKDEKLPR